MPLMTPTLRCAFAENRRQHALHVFKCRQPGILALEVCTTSVHRISSHALQESVANATVLRLTKELAFIDEVLAAANAGQLRGKDSSYFVDRFTPATCGCQPSHALSGCLHREVAT